MCTACFLRSRQDDARGGEACAVCGLDDPERLVRTRLAQDAPTWLCHDHAWVARCAWPPPATVHDLVWLLTRRRTGGIGRDPNPLS